MSNTRILVVGTTPDYIAHLISQRPQRVLFLTDSSIRAASMEEAPSPDAEVVTNLTDYDRVVSELEAHLARTQFTLGGLVCFDCESLPLAASLAQHFNVNFPSPEAIALSQSKYESKRVWREQGIPCPSAEVITSPEDVHKFCDAHPGSVVIKPDISTGSRLIYKCRTTEEAVDAYLLVQKQLAMPTCTPEVVIPFNSPTQTVSRIVIETFAKGLEYSADILIDRKEQKLIRIARKVIDSTAPTGTALAYQVPAEFPDEVIPENLLPILVKAAHALKIERALVMVDFKLVDDLPILLEMTPRLGGDCLPPLIKSSCGLDVLSAALDFASGDTINIPALDTWLPRIGLQLISNQAGTIRRLSVSALQNDPRTICCMLKRDTGHQVVLPPDDYDSRILGYAIFVPTPRRYIVSECRELSEMLALSMVHKRNNKYENQAISASS